MERPHSIQLDNGQVWEQVPYEYYYHYAYGPAVTIQADGQTGVLEVEGVSRTLQVRQIM